MLDLAKNSDLLGKVFLTLIFQLLVTFCVIYSLSSNPILMKRMFNWVVMLILFIVSLGLVIIIAGSKASTSSKFVMFTIFSILFGVMLSPIGLVNRNILLAAAGGTLAIFVVMFLAGAVLTRMRVDLSMMGMVLFACLTGLLVGTLVMYLFGVRREHVAWVYFGLVVYSLYIVFDTQMIIRNKRVDFVSGALSYYLDIIGIFLRLLRLQKQ